MEYIYLISIILGLALQNAIKKNYNKKNNRQGLFLFCGLVSFFAMIFFSILSGGFKMHIPFLPYSLAFAAAYSVASSGTIFAIAWGKLSLTNLIISLSLIIPTFYGIFFLGDTVSFGFILGLIFLFISLALINIETKESKAVSIKWLIAVTMGFVGNGLCNIIQKEYQLKFGNECKNEFMIIALSIVTIIMVIIAFINERQSIKTSLKTGWFAALISGAANGMVNLFVLILNGMIPVSIMYPLINSGGIIATYIIARLVYKEKLSKKELYGFIIGIFALILLNI